jgi:hypothetical protein
MVAAASFWAFALSPELVLCMTNSSMSFYLNHLIMT